MAWSQRSRRSDASRGWVSYSLGAGNGAANRGGAGLAGSVNGLARSGSPREPDTRRGLRLAELRPALRALAPPGRAAPGLRPRTSFVLWAIGFALIMTPGRVGELLKLVLLRKLTAVPLASSAPILVVERGAEAVALGLVALGGSLLLLSSAEPLRSNRELILAGGLLCGLALVVAGWRRALGLVERAPLARSVLARPGFGQIWANLLRGGEHLLTWRVRRRRSQPDDPGATVRRTGDRPGSKQLRARLPLAAGWLLIGSSGFLGGISLMPGGAGVAEATLLGLLLVFGAVAGHSDRGCALLEGPQHLALGGAGSGAGQPLRCRFVARAGGGTRGMKLFLATLHPRRLSGQVDSLLSLGRELEALDQAVELVTPFDRAALHQPQASDAALFSVGTSPIGKLLALLKGIRRVALAGRRADLIQLNLPTPAFGWVADLVRAWAARPVVVSFEAHLANVVELLRGGYVWRDPAFYLPRLAINNGLCGRASAFTCERYLVASTWQRAELQALGAPDARLVTLPNLIDLHKLTRLPRDVARSQLGLDPDAQLVGWAGHFHHVKGLDVLLEAFARMIRDRPRSVWRWPGAASAISGRSWRACASWA